MSETSHNRAIDQEMFSVSFGMGQANQVNKNRIIGRGNTLRARKDLQVSANDARNGAAENQDVSLQSPVKTRSFG